MSIRSRNPAQVFADRAEAGRALGDALQALRTWQDPLVLALPRGGVPVGFEVARALHGALDVLVVRKIGHPQHEEFALGAIAAGGIMVMNPESRSWFGGALQAEVDRVVERERAELARRERLYRGAHPAEPVQGRDVILVDDGLATGATMRAAVQALRRMAPERITVAVPVAAPDSCAAMREAADEVVCVRTPDPFFAVGAWYAAFPQTSDEEVRVLLEAAHRVEN